MKLTSAFVLSFAGSALSQATQSVGECVEDILVIARGSTEQGNVGSLIGAPLCNGLKRRLGPVFGCQGVGTQDGYPAGMGDNSKPKGTCEECITGTVKMFTNLAAKCPKAKFMFMGYSQGGALMSNAIPALTDDVRKKVIGGVLFGSTRGTIDKYPKENWISLCAQSDNVCAKRGNTSGTGSHLSYSSNGDVDKAVDFLVKRVEANGGKAIAGPAPAKAAPAPGAAAPAAGGMAGMAGMAGMGKGAGGAAPAAGGMAGMAGMPGMGKGGKMAVYFVD